MPIQIQEKQIVVNDQLINYYFSPGGKNKENLILLHGWRSNATIWKTIIPALSEKEYAIYSLDLPGFGKSQAPKKDFVVGDYAQIVDGFVKKCGLKKVVIIGHSNGGRICLKLAATNPNYLKEIVLVNSSGIYHEPPFKSLKMAIAKLLKPFFSPYFMHQIRKKIYEFIGADDYIARPDLAATFVNLLNEDLTPLLSSIKSKTLIIWGENDLNEYTPLKDANLMREKIVGSRLVILDNAGHFSFLDQPEKFVEAVLRFLS